MGFLSILSFAHALIRERLRPGELAIDATVGNGVDTLFLCETVGPKGTVYGFDVQPQALESASLRLAARGHGRVGAGGSNAVGAGSGCTKVHLLLRSHAELLRAVPEEEHGTAGAVMFNLGYLPGADRAVVTAPASTLPALAAALTLLRRGGVATIALYTGHEGGAAEAEAVAAWAAMLPQSQYRVLQYQFLNQKNAPPYLIAIEKV
ncbi:SAM-dependent methyltransferase [Paenibacillus swuensis]|uniref:SAM-dependent methyltransferase n=1 Tax=Paenibacillus swuensis TaxID=1178515 RepID=A0A172TGZ5_9BACL|nr:class I SAM-dependent methyltransferase [Paenibacillus swuensis]ANE46311.1 SAM-dependent methyltransferase [Paenibacillus swuensis]